MLRISMAVALPHPSWREDMDALRNLQAKCSLFPKGNRAAPNGRCRISPVLPDVMCCSETTPGEEAWALAELRRAPATPSTGV